MNILLSAYYCSPYQGGESAVGWRFATGLAKDHDVTVICGDLSSDSPTAADIARYKREHGLPPRLGIHCLQAEPRTVRIHDAHARPGLWFLFYEAYRRWQLQVLGLARELHAARPFDVVHHLTVIGYREPGYLWQLGIPFVWGPINGAAMIPWKFIAGFGFSGAYRHLTRNVMNAIQMRLPSRSRKAAEAAAKIWAVTQEDRDMVESIWKCHAELMIETGATPCASAVTKTRAPGEPLRLVWCGIVEARKALHLLLEALGKLPASVAWTLDVIGDGPQRKDWEALAAALGLDHRVRWVGKVDHSTAQQMMGGGHVLVHSSLKEGTPHVVLEAMSRGLPVICHDACGMGVAVDHTSGIKVPLRSPRESIGGFLEAVLRLATTEGLLESLSAGAIARARGLSWESKIEKVSRTYREIAAPKPGQV